ncbi:MAG: energy-coupling factor transporter transmembrane component T [Thermoguttaceae bacterium]
MASTSPRTSFVSRLDPRVKIAWSAVVSVLAVMLRHPAGLAVLLGVALSPWCMVRPPFRLRWLFAVVATTVVGSMFSQGLFYVAEPRTEWLPLLPGVSLCTEGIVYGAIVSLRLLAVLAAGGLVVLATRPPELIAAMRRLRVPESLAVTLTLALRLLPEIGEQGRTMLAADRATTGGRGLWSAMARFRRLLLPLVATALSKAREAAEVESEHQEPGGRESLRFTTADWAALLGVLLVAAVGVTMATVVDRSPWGAVPQTTNWLCAGLLLVLLAIAVGLAMAGSRRRLAPVTAVELAIAAALICLLRIAVLPWQIGLAKLPGLNVLIFAIPYTVVFLIGLRLAPRLGFAALLIVGQGLFGQLLGSGINPAWWPYYAWCALGVEALLLLTGYRVQRPAILLAVGILRGLLAESYYFLIAAPFISHKFYDPWYVVLMLSMEAVGCAIGAAVAWQLSPAIEKAVGRSLDREPDETVQP